MCFTHVFMLFIPEMLKKSVQHVIDDSSFHINVEPAATALQQAKSVMEWGSKQENEALFKEFEDQLVLELNTCFPSGSLDVRSLRTIRSDMCRQYHKVRTSPHFTALWSSFIKRTSSSPPQPTFYQEVTDLIFEELVQKAFPVVYEGNTSPAASITYEDANVIRYAAGYICRKVYDKIQKLSQSNKPQLMKCVMELLEEDGAVPFTASADWVNEVDRGGLWHVREGTYMLFSAMEEEVREHFQMSYVRDMKEDCKEKITAAVKDNDDVLFHWCMLTTETAEDDAQEVLEMLIHLWITIRGYSFAGSWLEMYKQEKKKSLQRSKALRKGLN